MKTNLRIGMILDNEFSGDMRVENEVQALVNAGHEVFVFCLTYGSKPESENYHGASIIRIPISKFAKNKLNGLNNTIFNFYPGWWSKRVLNLVKEYPIDVLHVHDLWMMEAGIKISNKLNVPIVADLHENYVHALANYKWSTTFPGSVLVSQNKWKRKEKEWLKMASDIIVVIEEAKNRVEKIAPDKHICVVANYVNIEDFKVSNPTEVEELKMQYAGDYIVTYTGGMDLHRGLENVVRAIPSIIKSIVNFKLVLVGTGSNVQDLKDLASQLNVTEYVIFKGWQYPEDLPAYMSTSDACIIPHMKTAHTDNTIPHKLFHYMLMNQPVLVSDCEPLKRIVKETDCGFIFKQNSIEDIAEKIIAMSQSKSLSLEMADRGRQAVLSKYNWRQTAKNLTDLYQKYIN